MRVLQNKWLNGLAMAAIAVTAFAAVPASAAGDKASVIETIQKRGTLKVGMATFVPWAMRDKTGKLIGFEIDIATRAAKDMGVAFLGSTVKLKDLSDDDVDVYKLVGEASGDVPTDYVEVTANSPMGDALMKAAVGDVITVKAPRGNKKFAVIEIV